MSRLESVLQQAARDLDDLRCRWALVGALAVSARAEPRFTRDIDLAVAVSGDADAERLVRSLQERRYRVHAIVEQEATGRLATARFVPAGEDEGGIVVDALFASSGVEAEVVAAADLVEILPGFRAPVATTGHLMALKVLARDDRTRPQDRVDLVALTASANPEDIVQARAAIALIAQRGYHRGKDLAAELDEFLRPRRA
ncbi:MAG: nucleotidyl transferase AbiEii/AbiGii toxin family protein [Candidatus Rokuibacteriota bacterium]